MRTQFKNKAIKGVNVAVDYGRGGSLKKVNANDHFYETSVELQRVLRDRTPGKKHKNSDYDDGSQQSFR